MDFNKLTLKSQEAVAAAQELARRTGNPELYPEHLTLALLDQELPRQLVPDAAALRAETEEKLRARPTVSGTSGQPQASGAFARVLDQAEDEMRKLDDEYVSVEHLLLALDVVPRDALLARIKDVRGSQRVTSQDPEGSYQALEKFGRDFTELAEEGKLDPVIGRDEEIRRVIQVLSRRTKNNPVLIGEPGVGKTAIAEGLAQRIVDGDVPDSLKDRRVIALDAANLLKPMLARGELRAVGATTLDEYRKHIEKDAALERRFQPVFVEEPSVEDAIAILRGLKERYEVHHGVRIQDSAIVAAAMLSQRYIADRFLPDKAIDLIDESASRLRIEIDSMPTEIDVIERATMQHEMERQALKKEKDHASKERLNKIEKELVDLREKSSALKAEWQKEKAVLDEQRKLKEELDRLRTELERAQRRGELGKAAELRYGTLPSLQRELNQANESLET